MSFTPLPSLSRCSSREDIYRCIDSLSVFHQHLTYFEKAPAWEKLYACIRSYKRSHPAITDTDTAFQHHRLQVLGRLTEDLKTPSIDRHRKRKDRAAKRMGEDSSAPTKKTSDGCSLPHRADLSASLSLTSIHSVQPSKEPSPRCGCGTMVEANRTAERGATSRRALEISALREKLEAVRRVVGASPAAEEVHRRHRDAAPTAVGSGGLQDSARGGLARVLLRPLAVRDWQCAVQRLLVLLVEAELVQTEMLHTRSTVHSTCTTSAWRCPHQPHHRYPSFSPMPS